MRISFGGGGTELSPYVDEYGGCVLSASIGIYAQTILDINPNRKGIELLSQESGKTLTLNNLDNLNLNTIDSSLKLAAASLKYFNFQLKLRIPKELKLITGSEAPIGSGLGASSVLTVSIVHALQTFFKLDWSRNQIAEHAYQIERKFLALVGGLQDHYPAIYGGINFIEFDRSHCADIQPLNLKSEEIAHLESSLLLVYTGKSRESANIIELQKKSIENHESSTLESLHQLKKMAAEMREAMKRMDVETLGFLLGKSWEMKKNTNPLISNSKIDEIHSQVLSAGAYGGKLSGAGGGGFLLFIVPAEKRIAISNMISREEYIEFPVNLTTHGLQTWNTGQNV